MHEWNTSICMKYTEQGFAGRWKGLSRCVLYQMIFIFQCDKIDEPHKA